MDNITFYILAVFDAWLLTQWINCSFYHFLDVKPSACVSFVLSVLATDWVEKHLQNDLFCVGGI